ncbi:eCIS core domain-containing protein [Kibdelosporangium aridum]|uniref:eCIS core domain-containing protein n=1 Tax=Kibdelosporangium aridum TaxID=2030 RepID=UPI0035E704FC
MASNRRTSIGGRLRGLISFTRRQPRAVQAAPVVSTKSLAVRPPWWRAAAQRLVGGLLPGFRSGSDPGPQSRPEPTYTPQRPLLARRMPLAGKASMLKKSKDTVIGGSTAQLAMAPPPGVQGVVQREAASIVVPPVQPLISTPAQRAVAPANVSGPVANSPGAITAAARTLAAQMASAQGPSAPTRQVSSAHPLVAGNSLAAPTPKSTDQAPAARPTNMPGPAPSGLAAAGRMSTVQAPAAQGLAVQRLAAAAYLATGQASSAISVSAAGEASPAFATQSATAFPIGSATSLFAARSPKAGPMSLPGQPPAPTFGMLGLSAPLFGIGSSMAQPGQPPSPMAQPGSMSLPGEPPLAAVAPEVAERPASPEQRWRAAVASVPLESPKPFPTSVRPLVAQLTGSADGASYTTGPATRRALAEVGALGATTGRVVHLAQQPSADPASLGVLAHELTHARSPITRPRFMLHNHTGSMDSDERHARTVGSQFETATPMRVQRLFGGGGLPSVSGLTNQATGALGSLGNQATGMVGGLANSATSAIGSGASELSNAASGMTERFSSAASGFANRIGEEAGSVSAGLIDNLPVGGGANGVVGAVSQIARTVVDNAVREATQGAISEANQAVSQMSQAAQGMVGQVQSMATDGVNGLAGQANQWVNGAMSQATGAVQDLGNQAMGVVGDAQNAVTSGVNQAMGAVGQVLGPGAQQALSGVDLDRIAEALEERLLRQLERRGGRYAGVF